MTGSSALVGWLPKFAIQDAHYGPVGERNEFMDLRTAVKILSPSGIQSEGVSKIGGVRYLGDPNFSTSWCAFAGACDLLPTGS